MIASSVLHDGGQRLLMTKTQMRDRTGKVTSDVDQTSEAKADDFVFPGRIHDSPHLGTRQYARILDGWVDVEVQYFCEQIHQLR